MPRKSLFASNVAVSTAAHSSQGSIALKLRVSSYSRDLFPQQKHRVTSTPAQAQDWGHDGHSKRQVLLLLLKPDHQAISFTALRKTYQNFFLNKKFLLLPNPIFNVLTKMRALMSQCTLHYRQHSSYYPLA